MFRAPKWRWHYLSKVSAHFGRIVVTDNCLCQLMSVFFFKSITFCIWNSIPLQNVKISGDNASRKREQPNVNMIIPAVTDNMENPVQISLKNHPVQVKKDEGGYTHYAIEWRSYSLSVGYLNFCSKPGSMAQEKWWSLFFWNSHEIVLIDYFDQYECVRHHHFPSST